MAKTHEELLAYNRAAQKAWKERLIANPVAFAQWKERRNLLRKNWKTSPANTGAAKKAKNIKLRDKLTDGYVAMTLGLKLSEVPKPIIEAKRQIILLKRTVKGIQQ